MAEKAAGKDTTSGHWELAGLTLETPFPTYPDGFPEELIREFEEAVGMEVIGNKAASGTQIIEELGPEHLKTGKLIVYTSADSVFQIAAHESVIPPEELWHICRVARSLLTGKNAVGRVIARPFAGEPGHFVRTANRRDFSVNPVGETMLDVLKNAGFDVLGVGKIEDIFNHRGLTQSNHAVGNEACMDAAMEFLKKDYWKGLMFVNLICCTATAMIWPVSRGRWRPLTSGCPHCSGFWVRIRCSSSPRITDAIRLFPPPIIPGSMCRFWFGDWA